ncbi:MAG: PPOX class F420-dependent oxidoreductase [Thermomicrobiales bacterium]
MATNGEQTVIPATHADLLESKALAYVATIGPKGEPQVNPVWFGWDGQHLSFSQTTTRQKIRNVERDPRVALAIVDPENPFRYLEIRGKVVRVDPDPELDFINAMAQKYVGVEKYQWHDPRDQRVVVVVAPEHTTQMG